MSIGRNVLLRMFGRPRGLLGRLGGVIMARTNHRCATWVVDLLDVQRQDSALEIGFGSWRGNSASGRIGALCRGRRPFGGNAAACDEAQCRGNHIGNDRVDLRQGSADRLPSSAESFDKAMAINSMQVRPNALAGLREIWRVLKPGGRVALAFTVHSGQRSEGVPNIVVAAGFTECRPVEADQAFCLLATKP
jgi:SAM-dependent methyltransferase